MKNFYVKQITCTLLALLWIGIGRITFGQTTSRPDTTLESSENIRYGVPDLWSIGVETDLLPYLTGGYYAAVNLGYRGMRLRTVYSQLYPPDFITPSGFYQYDLASTAYLLDYFLGKKRLNFEGPWLSAGFEHWQQTAVNENNNISGDFTSSILTFGGGYIWYLFHNVYLNPWLAAHLVVNDNSTDIGGNQFESDRIIPSVSLKLGWNIHFKKIKLKTIQFD